MRIHPDHVMHLVTAVLGTRLRHIVELTKSNTENV